MNTMKLQKATRKLLNQLKKADQISEVVYKRIVGDPIYDTTKGEEVYQTESFMLFAHISSYTRREISNDVLITDKKAVLFTDNLSLIPKINDTIEIDELTHTIISIVGSYNPAAYELQLRSA